MITELTKQAALIILENWGFKVKENKYTTKIKNENFNRTEFYNKDVEKIDFFHYINNDRDCKRLIMKRDNTSVLFWKDGTIWTQI